MADREQSAYARFPGYRVDLGPCAGLAQARCRGVVVAESAQALRVLETRHAPRIYFPRCDVRMEHLARTEHRTYCPFKGHASYWSVRIADRVGRNAAWSYEAPMDEVAGLACFIAFHGELAEDGTVEISLDE